MKIVILAGSPHKKGTSGLLADAFAQGAKAAGAQVTRWDVAGMDVHPCTGCDFCRSHGGACVFGDGFSAVRESVLEADAVVFATPLYYFGMSAQLKAVLDRFHAVSALLAQKKRRTALLATCSDTDAGAMEALELHFRKVTDYLGWESTGAVLALGVPGREDIEATAYPQAARRLGEKTAAAGKGRQTPESGG